MRWAFFLLLFLNVAFLIWHEVGQPANEPATVSATKVTKSPGGNKSIRLLHEVDISATSVSATAAPGSTTTAPRTREPPRPAADDSSRAGSARGGDDSSRAGSARSANDLRAASPAEPSLPLSEIEKKVLAAEARQTERIEANLAARKSEERTARERPRSAAEPEATACFALGSFGTLDAAADALAMLASLGLDLRTVLREREIRSTQQWWVIDATKDEYAAQKRLDELHKKKVTDASIISSGEYANMISLGKYDSEALANKRVNALVRSGFRPVVEKHFDSTMQYWVDVAEIGGSKVTDEQLQEIIGAADGVEKQQRACK